jgi:PAS domain S-box-containing protein
MPHFAVDAVLVLLVIAFGAGMLYALRSSRAQIAQMRRQEKTLRQLSRAVEQSPSTVVITDLKGDIEYVNPKFTALTGYTLDEARGKNPRILKSGHTPDAEYAELWRTISAGGEWRGEFLNKKKNGDLYWEFASISPIKDSAGRITHYLAVKEDITARKQAEEALRQSEARSEALFIAIPDLVFRLNRDGVCVDARGARDSRLKVRDEPYNYSIDKTVYDLLPEPVAQKIHDAIHRTLDTGQMQTLEYRLETLSGPVDFEARMLPLGPDEVISAVRDVTERKRLEAALYASEEKYRNVAERALDGIGIIQEDLIQYCNPQLAALVGQTPDDIVGRPFSSIIVPEDRTRVEGIYHRRLHGEPVPSRYETILAHKDGHHVYVEIEAGIIQYEDRPAVLKFVRNVTERKQTEEQIRRQNRDLTLLNRVIGAAGLTLDMTELLTTICRELALAFDVPQAATALIDVDRITYEVTAEYLGPGRTSALGVRFPIENNPVVDYMLAHRTPLAISDVRTDPRLVWTPEGRENIEARGTVSMLIVPLLVGGELIGTIGLDATEPREFTEDEITLASNVAAALSQILHNADLYRQLRANQARLRAILDNAAVGIALLDVQGRYIQANDRWAEMLGYPPDELTRRSHFSFVHPEDAPGCQQRLLALRRGELETYRFEVRFVCQTGDVFWGDTSVSAIRSPEGALDALVVVVIDVTERIRTDEALRIKDSAIASSNNGIALADLQGNLTYANAAMLDMWGYAERREVIGRSTVDFWLDPEQAAGVIQAMMAEGSWMGEMVAQRKDGTPFDVQLSASRVTDADGQPICLMASFVDITERKRAEAERERLIQELDAFAHTVAHDLKTPLQGIVGYSSLLGDELAQFNNGELAHYLDVIEQYGQKMNSIINELLLLASVRKQEDVKMVQVRMAPIIASVLKRLDLLIRQHQAEIVTPPDGWPVACGYAPWIEEVWANYISNAIKYGGSPPRVELGADVLLGGRVCFWVRDNGAGLPPEKLDRLFAEFSRLEHARLEGHGLGLSIVRRIMDRMGGEVGVESTVGQGSIFSFTLPGGEITCTTRRRPI